MANGNGKKADAEAPATDPRTVAANRRLAEANASKAEADAATAELNLADSQSVLGRQRRDAIARKDTATADKDAAAARREELSALIPDLSKVRESKLSVPTEGPPIGGTALTYGAVGDAAEMIAQDVLTTIGLSKPAESWILVTSNPDLSDPDGVYHEVVSGLEQLEQSAKDVLAKVDDNGGHHETLIMAAATVVGALAGALPSVLSLLSAQRSVRTSTVTVTDLAATAAVAGALRARAPQLKVLHDDFRLVQAGKTYDAVGRLSARRQELTAREIELTDAKTRTDADLATATADEKDLAKVVADSTKPSDAQKKALADVRQRVADLATASGKAAIRISVIESIVASIDTFTAAIRTAPAGGSRTPLSTAALHELLHPATTMGQDGKPDPNLPVTPATITHVLLVKAQSGTAVEMTDDKPLWFQDKFTSVVDVSVTYMLIQTADSQLLDADTVTATASAHGNIGERPVIDVELPAPPPRPGDPIRSRTPRVPPVWEAHEMAAGR